MHQQPQRHWHPHWHRRLQAGFRRSLRWRLLALFLLLALALSALFIGASQRLLAQGFGLIVQPLLSDYVDRLAQQIGSPPDVGVAERLSRELPITIHIDGPVVHWGRAPHALRFHEEGLSVRRTADGHVISFGLNAERWREGHRFVSWWPIAGVLVATLLVFAAVRRLFRPVDDIRAGVLRYGAGRFDAPIPIRRRDELGELATQVNAMARSLQGMLGSQRELLLAISHELRSPLTRARLNAELLPEAPEREALLRDLAAMRELIAGLLEGERLAAGSAALQREPSDLNTLVREVVATHFAAARDRGLLALDLAEPLPVLALDRPRVQMLLRNLIDNALRHGQAEAGPSPALWLSTQADARGESVTLSVRDRGPGVPPEQLERLSQAFYRPDDARARSAGGVGLGLFLCRRVAESHGAEFSLHAADPGLEVRVRFAVALPQG